MPDDKDDTPDKHWHLDKKVPLALIFAIALQTATITIWGARLDNRVDQLERSEAMRATIAPVAADRLTRVEVKVDTALDGILEIKRLIQRAPN